MWGWVLLDEGQFQLIWSFPFVGTWQPENDKCNYLAIVVWILFLPSELIRFLKQVKVTDHNFHYLTWENKHLFLQSIIYIFRDLAYVIQHYGEPWVYWPYGGNKPNAVQWHGCIHVMYFSEKAPVVLVVAIFKWICSLVGI